MEPTNGTPTTDISALKAAFDAGNVIISERDTATHGKRYEILTPDGVVAKVSTGTDGKVTSTISSDLMVAAVSFDSRSPSLGAVGCSLGADQNAKVAAIAEQAFKGGIKIAGDHIVAVPRTVVDDIAKALFQCAAR